MLIWVNLYFLLYISLILSLYYILDKTMSNKNNNKSLVFWHMYLLKYSKVKNLYLSILLSLTGLPPFLVFFIKANYILSFIGTLSFYSSLFVVISYFINMLFYTQLYLYKNYVFDNLNFLNINPKQHNLSVIFKINLLLIVMLMGVVYTCELYYIGNAFFFN
jgi:hypothetical protein